jgi:hypothetical protein
MKPAAVQFETTLSISKKYRTNRFKQRDVLAKWRASGLSQAAFCRQEGIPEWQLSNWKRREMTMSAAPPKPRRRKENTTSPDSSIEFAAVEESSHSPNQRNGAQKGVAEFVPLFPQNTDAKIEEEVLEAMRAARQTPVAELCFGEVCIRIWRGTDQDTLRMLFQLLKENSLC